MKRNIYKLVICLGILATMCLQNELFGQALPLPSGPKKSLVLVRSAGLFSIPIDDIMYGNKDHTGLPIQSCFLGNHFNLEVSSTTFSCNPLSPVDYTVLTYGARVNLGDIAGCSGATGRSINRVGDNYTFNSTTFPFGSSNFEISYLRGWDYALAPFSFTCQPTSSNSGFWNVEVRRTSSATFTPPTLFCATDGSIDLNGYVNIEGGSFSGSGVSGTIFNPAIAGGGTHSLTYSITYDNVGSVPQTLNVNVVVQPDNVDAGSNLTVCSADSPFTLTGGSPSGGAWSGTGVSGGNFIPASANIGNNTVSYQATTNGCTYTDTRNITVNANPSVEAGGNVQVCRPRTLDPVVTVSVAGGSSPAGGIWSCTNCSGFTLSGTGSFSNDAPVGTYNIVYTVTQTGCTSTDTKSLTINEPPNIIMPSNPTICTGNNYNINPIVTGTGLSYSWSPTTNLNDPFRRNPTVQNVTTSRTYTLTVTDGNGCNEFESITVNHDGGTTVEAGPNLTRCENDSPFNLTGFSPSGGTWSGSGISGNVFNPGVVATGVTIVLTYSYVNGNGCPSSDSRNIVVYAQPSVNAGTTVDVCIAPSGTSSIIAGRSPSGGTWSCPGCPSGTITSASAGTVRNNTSAGDYTFIYSYTNGNGCSNSDSKTVRFNTPPVAVASADIGLCALGQMATLDVSATGGSGGYTYVWSPTTDLSDPFRRNPVVTMNVASRTYTVTVTDSRGCNASDNMTVTTGGPSVDAGSDFSICADQQIFNITGATPSGGTWSGPGVVNEQFMDGTTLIPGLSYTITYEFTDGNGCQASDTRLVTINDLPNVSIAGIVEACTNDGAVNLTGGTPSGGTWSGSGVSGSQWFPSVAGDGIHLLTYSVTNGNGCSDEATINARAFDPPDVFAGFDQSICINSGLVNLSGFNPAGITFSGTGIVGGTGFDPVVATLGQTVITASFTDGDGCAATDTKLITVVDVAVVSFIQSSISLCKTGGSLNLNSNLNVATPTGGTWSGTGVSGVNFNPINVSAGTYTITYTYTNPGNCVDQNTFDITVTDNPTITFLQRDLGICNNVGLLDMQSSAPTPAGGTWTSPYVSGSDFDPTLVPNAGTYSVQYVISGSCGATEVVNVEVYDPTPVNAGQNLSFCSNESAQLITGGSPSGGTYSGTGVSSGFFDPSIGSGTYTITYSYTNNDGCSSVGTRTFTVNDPPVVDAGNNITLCSNASSFALINDVNIIGGSFSSPSGGISGLNLFPNLVGIGVHEIIYSYTDPLTDCITSDSRFITVINPAVVSVGSNFTVCIDGGVTDLTGLPVSIMGGVWSGSGVIGTDFNPASAGVGVHEISYDVSDGSGCTTRGTVDITVEDLPTVEAGSDEFVCAGAPLVSLGGGASPIGGTWSGLFVVGSNFDVGSSGSGIFDVTYTYTSPSGCVNSDTKQIIVDPGTTVDAGGNFSVCESDGLFDLANRVTPGGGSFSGPGVNGNNFNPNVGPGTYTITYSLNNAFGCAGTDDILVTVNGDPTTEAGTDATLCLNESPLDLTATAVPAGGIFTGSGVVGGNSFDPSISGIGDHLITYTFTNGNGCVGTDTREITVTELPNADAGSNQFICISQGLIDLDLDASPANGSWSGNGVTNGIFDPVAAGVGQQVLVYTITQGNGCTGTDNRIIQVFADLVIDAGINFTVCTNDAVVNLDQNVSIGGGDWTGIGIEGSNFDPSSVSAGVYPLTYSVTDQYGCSATDFVVATVTAPQNVSVGSDLTVCVTSSSINLAISVSPAGGTFTGSGVSGNIFDPALAGTGEHEITYSIVDGNGCTASNKRTITVIAAPIVDAGSNLVTCVSNNEVDLDIGVSIQGGTWLGTGVNGSFFNPSLAGIGAHVLTYTVDDGNGCISVDNRTITVRSDIVVDAGIDRIICVNGTGIDLAADPSRTGGDWSGSGISGNIFNPSVAGPGVHVITYTYSDSFSCQATDNKTITVNNTVLVDAGPVTEVCNTVGIVDLSLSATPSGGTWTGAGITGNVFNATAVGNGVYELTYSFTDGNSCMVTDIRQMTVVDSDPVSVGNNQVVCLSSAVIELDLSSNVIGGNWSGNGTNANRFNPALAGIGTHKLTFTFDNGGECISMADKLIEVKADVTVDAGVDSQVCVNESLIDLSVGVDKIGGLWSGLGVVENSFDPSLSGLGIFTLTYIYTDGYGCTAIDTRVITVVDSPQVDAGPTAIVCTSAPLLDLNATVFPIGGNWTGAGVVGSDFNPALVGIGTYDLTYSYTDGNGCSSSDERSIEVVNPDPIDAGANFVVCLSSDPVNLDLNVSEVGGVWSGDGINNNIFIPANAGLGSHTLTYTFDDGLGCIDSDVAIVLVRDDLLVDAGVDLQFCFNSSPKDLSNDPSQKGGNWFGTGIDGNIFDPVDAGVGTHVITYEYADGLGCNASDTRVFTVNNIPSPDGGPSVRMCITGGVFDLVSSGFPTGGTWSGQGVIGNIFDPQIVGVGEFSLIYSYDDGSGCVNTDNKSMFVEIPPSIDAGQTRILCENAPSIDLDLDVSAQGGSWSGDGLDGSFFNAASASVGTHTLTYTLDDGNGCISEDTKIIIVRADISVNAGADFLVCLSDGTVDLTNDVDKLGGTWSGPGIDGNNFDPVITGVGQYILTYDFIDPVACTTSDTRIVTVRDAPAVDAGPPIVLCTTNGQLELSSSAFPFGGTWTGSGIDGTRFDPEFVGVGTYEVSYTVTDGFGCSRSDIREIRVQEPDPVDAGQTEIVCLNSDIIDLDLDVSTPGGTWTGIAINGSFFDPSVAGTGSHILEYVIDDGNGCISTDTKIVQVRVNVTVDAGIDMTFCINENLHDLTNDPNKLGGTWTGPGVTDENFDPELADVGVHILNYTYTDPIGCVATDTRTFTVNAVQGVDAGPPSEICTTNGLLDLSAQGFPTGGIWTGQGVTGNDFDPLFVGEGQFDLTYTFADLNGCQNSDIKEVTVVVPDPVEAGPTTIVCVSNDQIDLDLEVSPPGGTWSGTGVDGSFFNPAIAGVGTYQLGYTFNLGDGCVSSDIRTIQVREDIVVNAGDDVKICVNAIDHDLTNDPDRLGGTWIGPGVSGNSFRPDIAGVGDHILSYTYVDAVSCMATDTRTFTVTELQVVDAGPDITTCTTAAIVDLSISSFPTGGTWTGPGVTGNNFDPGQVGNGNYTVSYTLNDGNGCQVIDTKEIRVQLPENIDAGANLTVCENSPNVDLDLDVSVQGGTWSGTGIDGSFFDPSTGIGTYTLTYTLDDGNGCVSTDSKNINVREPLTVSLGDPFTVCVNDDRIDLGTVASIVGGTWSGGGIINDFFDPAQANIGSNTLTYTVENEFGCSATSTLTITVLSLPAISAGGAIEVCIDNETIDLAPDVFPTGGVFNGNGMIGSVFHPDISGAGVHEIEYVFKDDNGCSNSEIRLITVHNLPLVNAGSDFDICVNAAPVQLEGVLPQENAAWSGNGVLAGFFNPLDAGVGNHDLVYSFTDQNGCQNKDSLVANVIAEPLLDIGESFDLCISDRPYDLSAQVNILGGKFDGDGVIGNFFNPELAGVGSKIISYEIPFNGCTIIEFKDITVHDLSPVSVGDDFVLCIDSDPYRLLNEVNQLGGTFNGVGIIEDIFYPDVAGLGSHVVEYSFTNAFGCISTDQRIISVQSQLNIDAGPDLSLCNSVVTFDLSVFGNPSGGVYVGTGITDDIFDPSVSGIGGFDITYVVESDNGCVSYDTLVVTVLPSTIKNFGQDTIICVTSSPLTLNFNSELATGSWSGDGVVNNQFFPSLTGVGTHSLNYQNSTLDCDIAGRRNITVVGLPNPATSSQTNVNGCEGEFINLIGSVSEEDRLNNVDIYWYRENESVAFNTGEIVNYEIVTSERIFYESVSQFGCASGQTNFISITRNNPSGEIAVSNSEAGFAKAVQFFANNIENAIDYEWDFGDGTLSTEKEPYHFYYESGTFNVSLKLTSNAGCSTTIRENDMVTVGLEPGREDIDVVLGNSGNFLADQDKPVRNMIVQYWPNPVRDKMVKVEVVSATNATYTIKSINLTGQIYDMGSVYLTRGLNEIEIDVSKMIDGLHPISLTNQTNGIELRFKLLKLK